MKWHSVQTSGNEVTVFDEHDDIICQVTAEDYQLSSDQEEQITTIVQAPEIREALKEIMRIIYIRENHTIEHQPTEAEWKKAKKRAYAILNKKHSHDQM